MTADMDERVKATNVTFEEFLQERDLLLMAKGDQTARGLAMELLRLMELLAIHGSIGIGVDPEKREEFLIALEGRIKSVITLR
jgi:hypothetical protein